MGVMFVMDEDNDDTQKSEYVNVDYSVHSHDADGDVYEHGIYLHFGHTRIRVAGGLDGFRRFREHLEDLERGMRATYPDD